MTHEPDTVELVARAIEPSAWVAFDNCLRPYTEGRGANGGGENFWYSMAWEAGARTPDQAREWFLEGCEPPYVGTYMATVRRSFVKARAALSILTPITPQAEWQPIETAPRDGSLFDVWANGERIPDCKWTTPYEAYKEHPLKSVRLKL